MQAAARKLSLFLAGDTMIMRPWSHVRDVDFLGLVDKIREADVAIANLETVIHTFKGHAQADSGGTYAASSPQIAAELKWAGFDMLAYANNHSFDYGTAGILETLEYAEAQGLIVAGAGKDLQDARAPRYLQRESGTVALVAMAVDFVPYAKASWSRPDLHGRPGINPLTTGYTRTVQVTPFLKASRSRKLGGLLHRVPWLRHLLDLKLSMSWGQQIAPADLDVNLQTISEAASNADLVVVSVHAHRQAGFLRNFAHQAIERGGHVVLVHGPHFISGIELFRDRPIFYSPGDFVFELEHIARLPAEAYERVGLTADAPVSEMTEAHIKQLSRPSDRRKAFEAFAALISTSEGQVERIRLLPLDLRFDSGDGSRGRPHIAAPTLGKEIIDRVARESRHFGTAIRYDTVENMGEVDLGRLRRPL